MVGRGVLAQGTEADVFQVQAIASHIEEELGKTTFSITRFENSMTWRGSGLTSPRVELPDVRKARRTRPREKKIYSHRSQLKARSGSFVAHGV
jgi:hypothetical protein